MAARKKVTRKVPPLELPPSATEVGRLGLRFEKMEDHISLVMDEILSLRQEMNRRFTEEHEFFENRSRVVEAVVRENSKDIRELKTDVARIDSRLERVEIKLDGKADTKRVDVLEGRVDRLEKRPA